MNAENKRVSAVVAVVVVAWLVLLAVRISTPYDDVIHRNPHGPYPTSLTIGFLDGVDSLNPYIGMNDASMFFYGLVYDCLTTYDEDVGVTGNLALSWWRVPTSDPAMATSGDPYGSVWEYNLTDNAYWHDGHQFTADDVVYSVNLNAWNYDVMWGCQPYSYFIDEAEKVDNNTVRIHFWDRATEEPMPVAWGDFIPIHILPKHLLELLPGGASYIGMNWTGLFSDDLSPGIPLVGTGPWIAAPDIMSDWTEGNHVTLVPNPSYHWKLDKPGAPEINMIDLNLRFFQDTTSIVLALKGGEIDVGKFPAIAYDAIKKDIDSGSLKNVSCFSSQSCAQGFVYLSYWMETDGGDNDARLDSVVRKAMLLAIDRDTMVDSIFLGYATPGTTVFPETSPWHYEPSASELMSFNVTAANELLESSGYVDVDSDGVRECTDISQAVQMGWVDEGTELNFTVPVFKPDGPEAKDIANYLKAAWSEIGVQGQYEVIDFTFYPMLCPIQQDVSVSWWHTLYPDPELMLFTQSSLGIGGWSDTEFSNASYDENFTRSVSAIDTGAREVYIDNCQRILYDQCPYSVLAYPNSNYAWRNDSIKGWGDWEAHPGRSLDAFWGANPLFFNLTEQWYTTESDSAFLTPSSVLNLVIVVAVAGTILVTYFVWKRLSHPERPPKTE